MAYVDVSKDVIGSATEPGTHHRCPHLFLFLDGRVPSGLMCRIGDGKGVPP